MQVLNTGEYSGEIVQKKRLDNVIITNTLYSTKNSNPDWHYHENLHICFVFQGGRAETRHATKYTRRDGSIFFYHAEERHRWISPQPVSKSVNIEVELDFLKKYHLSELDIKEESFQLQEYYSRSENRGRSIHTTENLPGKKMPDLPIYVLVNENTGSAAESFAYLLKHLERATIIGETTAGAGNGSNYFRVSNQFVIQIATWETINVITKTSWEKVGVVPNIASTSEEAYDKALALSKVAAKKQRAKIVEHYEKLLKTMETAVEQYPSSTSDDSLLNSFKECKLVGLINESEVNRLGYELLNTAGKTETAEAIFKVNTILYPESANVYDSYGEALAFHGKLEISLENYKKAVAIARKNGDGNLSLFVEGMERIKQQLADKK